ncbi:MAG: shikimate kinase [Phycisphaerales bacterium]|nr:shikimate kinase [Phycisphaerales bacterium]
MARGPLATRFRAAHIALIGLRGSGKSCVGRLLATRIALPFADTDEAVERRTGRTIADIFASDGEAAFRALESAALGGFLNSDRCVLSTGGGIVLDDDNRSLLRSRCACIWLSAPVDVLAARIAADPQSAARRPALGGATMIEELHAAEVVRRPYYSALADVQVDTGALAPDAVAGIIAEWLSDTGRLESA